MLQPKTIEALWGAECDQASIYANIINHNIQRPAPEALALVPQWIVLHTFESFRIHEIKLRIGKM